MHPTKRPTEPDTHIGFLDEAEGRRRGRPRKKPDDELDLDGVWNR